MEKTFKDSDNIIICDLDGTIVNTENSISKFTLDVLQKVSKNNTLIFATGRKIERILPLFPDGIVGDYVIASHGTQVFDIKNGITPLFKYRLNKDILISVFNLMKEKGFDDKIIVDQYFDREFNLENVPNIFHCFSIGQKEGINKDLIPFLSEIKNISFNLMRDSYSSIEWAYICPKYVSKASSLKQLFKLKDLNFDNTICFGDSINDKEIFEICNFRVAPLNAVDELKDICDCVCEDYNADGIAKWLESNILKIENETL